MSTPLFIGPDDVAQVLNLGRDAVYARLRDGGIPSIRVGRKIRVRVRDLVELTGLSAEEILGALDAD